MLPDEDEALLGAVKRAIAGLGVASWTIALPAAEADRLAGQAPVPLAGMTQVFQNKHWVVERDPTRPLVVVRRTSEPYASVSEVEASFRPLELALDASDRRAQVLLIDMRTAPSRNDPDFEAAASSHPSRFARGFLRLAILVRTAAGKLQAQRYFRERGVETALFTDEHEATSLLLAPPSSRRRR